MSDYISNPINVRLFDEHFRARRVGEGMTSLGENATLIQFRQGKTRWIATYQNEEASMTFEGTIAKAREWLEARP